jgi:hypothetical protein
MRMNFLEEIAFKEKWIEIEHLFVTPIWQEARFGRHAIFNWH